MELRKTTYSKYPCDLEIQKKRKEGEESRKDLLFGFRKSGRYVVEVDDFPPLIHIFPSIVRVVDIVRVFPHVETK